MGGERREIRMKQKGREKNGTPKFVHTPMSEIPKNTLIA